MHDFFYFFINISSDTARVFGLRTVTWSSNDFPQSTFSKAATLIFMERSAFSTAAEILIWRRRFAFASTFLKRAASFSVSVLVTGKHKLLTTAFSVLGTGLYPPKDEYLEQFVLVQPQVRAIRSFFLVLTAFTLGSMLFWWLLDEFA